MSQYVIEGINPEPWTSPEVAVGRKGGKPFPIVHKSAGLRAYQAAVAGEVKLRYPDVEPLTCEVDLAFYLWRQLPQYEGATSRVTKHQADATNMQKALEDALQGVLFKNDRQVVHVATWVMEQSPTTEPFILVMVSQCDSRPSDVVATARMLRSVPKSQPDNSHLADVKEEVF